MICDQEVKSIAEKKVRIIGFSIALEERVAAGNAK